MTLRDLGQVRLRDLASPERIFQVMHPDLRERFPALRSLEATPNNLAQQLTSFVGRRRELEDARALLRNTRLLTLFGAGGIGKTRLSQQLAADVMDDFPDGVWFVELAAISDPLLVPQSVAIVLGVKEEAGRPVVEALLKFLRDRKLLLVLDNCEHLMQACADLTTRLLRSSAQIKVVASSREPMRISGEAIYPVPALAVPDPGKGGHAVRFSPNTKPCFCSSTALSPRRPHSNCPTRILGPLPDMPATGRNSAGDRTGRGPRAVTVGGDNRGPPG